MRAEHCEVPDEGALFEEMVRDEHEGQGAPFDVAASLVQIKCKRDHVARRSLFVQTAL